MADRGGAKWAKARAPNQFSVFPLLTTVSCMCLYRKGPFVSFSQGFMQTLIHHVSLHLYWNNFWRTFSWSRVSSQAAVLLFQSLAQCLRLIFSLVSRHNRAMISWCVAKYSIAKQRQVIWWSCESYMFDLSWTISWFEQASKEQTILQHLPLNMLRDNKFKIKQNFQDIRFRNETTAVCDGKSITGKLTTTNRTNAQMFILEMLNGLWTYKSSLRWWLIF